MCTNRFIPMLGDGDRVSGPILEFAAAVPAAVSGLHSDGMKNLIPAFVEAVTCSS
jgi:hypothetical protein